MKAKPSALERLLRVRIAEKRAAEQTFTQARAAETSAETALEETTRRLGEARHAFKHFLDTQAAQRSGGFTIAQRQLDAQGERTLLAAVDDAILLRKRSIEALDRAREDLARAKASYMAARDQVEMVQKRLDKERAQERVQRDRAAHEDLIDTVVSYQTRNDHEDS